MKHKNLLMLGITLISSAVLGQTATLPYTTGFDNATQQAGWQEYKKAGTATGGWQYNTFSVYSPPNVLFQIYSTSEVLDNWFVSPGFSIPAGGTMDSIRYMFDGFDVPGTNDTIALYLLNGSKNPSLASKTLLFDIRGANYVNDGVYRKKTNINLPAGPGLSYFAIRFKDTAQFWLQTSFDNLSISALSTAPVSSFSVSSNNICKGEHIKFTDLSTGSPTSLSWQFAGGTPSVSTLSTPTVSYSNAGVYTASLVSSNASGAGNTYTVAVTVNVCTGITELQDSEGQALVYPNPGAGKFILRLTSGEIKNFTIYNPVGEKILTGKIGGQIKSTPVDIENQPAGVYFLKIGDGSSYETIKILKN